MTWRAIICSLMGVASFVQIALLADEQHQATVTQIFHDVQLMPAEASPRPASLNDTVNDDGAVRTGDDSRSELTYSDLTITRLGANTLFSFNRADRRVQLDAGSILVYLPKDSGGAAIRTKAVSVAITGTTLIVESSPIAYDRLLVLEGTARLSLNGNAGEVREVRAGQILNVNAGAKKLPKPGRVDLRRILKTHPLIKNFPPLPSLDLILAGIRGGSPPRTTGGGGLQGPSAAPSYVPPRPPVGTRNPPRIPPPNVTPNLPTPLPTATIKPRPRPTPRRTPTPSRPVASPRPSVKPSATPRKRFPPPKKLPSATPSATQIIR